MWFLGIARVHFADDRTAAPLRLARSAVLIRAFWLASSSHFCRYTDMVPIPGTNDVVMTCKGGGGGERDLDTPPTFTQDTLLSPTRAHALLPRWPLNACPAAPTIADELCTKGEKQRACTKKKVKYYCHRPFFWTMPALCATPSASRLFSTYVVVALAPQTT